MFEHYPPPVGTEIIAGSFDASVLDGQLIAIVGYGTMGRAHALNLVRSGQQVVVGSREGSGTGQRAREEGLEVLSVAEATARADVVMLMLPDEAMAAAYEAEVAPALGADTALGFAHGFAIAFDSFSIPIRIPVPAILA